MFRSLALAQAWQDRGDVASFASAEIPGSLAERLSRESCEVCRIPAPPGSTGDAQASHARAVTRGANWVVLDGYHFSREYQREIRAAGVRVLAVDDYGHCPAWDADLVLNQNPHAHDAVYELATPGARVLRGPRFALLRREFRARLPRPREASPIRRILVTLGGSDLPNVTGRILAALDTLRARRLEIRVLLGAANPHGPTLRAAAGDSFHAVECLDAVTDMPSLYEWADGVVSAAGSTCYEWLYYRIPAVALVIADNQRPIADALGTARIAPVHPDATTASPSELAGLLDEFLANARDPERFDHPVLAIDGLGAERVASLLAGDDLYLRPAIPHDARQTFFWANDPEVRRNGFHPETIPWDTHQRWFHSTRTRPDARFYLGELPFDGPAGQVRFHLQSDGAWEIGILVAPERRGQGLALPLLRAGLNRFRRDLPAGTRVLARIKPTNAPSLRLFASAGFTRVSETATAVEMLLAL